MDTLTQEQLAWLEHNANRIPITKIVELILKYDNLSLEDFEHNLTQDNFENLNKMLNQRIDSETKKEKMLSCHLIERGNYEWESLLSSIHMMDSLEHIKENISDFKNKYENIEELSAKVECAKAIDKLLHHCLSDESVYEFLLKEKKNPNILRIPILEFLSRLFRENKKLMFFAIACNLYAYVIHSRDTEFEQSAKCFLSVIDDNQIFGRYMHSTYDIDKYLLPYTYRYIPELSYWIELLEYTNNIYPCMPDMNWWKSEGKFNVAKSIFVSTREFCEKFPRSAFIGKAITIGEKEISTLNQWLYNDMRKFPEKYNAVNIRHLIGLSSSDGNIDIDYTEPLSPLHFFLRYKLTIDPGDLILQKLVSETYLKSILDSRNVL